MSVERCPRAGSGVHYWLLSEANRCRHRGLTPAATAAVLRDATKGCGRVVPEAEIAAAVRKAFDSTWSPMPKLTFGTGSKKSALGPQAKPRKASRWPEPDPKRIAAVVKAGYGLADLWAASPIRLEGDGIQVERIVPRLFPGNPLLCCGISKRVFDTRPLDQWRGQFGDLQFIVPSPMTDVWGITQDGRRSKHTLNNTGPRRFMVVESDQGTADTQAAILLHLAQYAPIVCTVNSAGKSLHGWFFVAGQPEEKVEKFFRYARLLGADLSTWARSQFVRMPDGIRDTGKRQTVFFFSARPLEVTP
jgi:hypothetical protein